MAMKSSSVCAPEAEKWQKESGPSDMGHPVLQGEGNQVAWRIHCLIGNSAKNS